MAVQRRAHLSICAIALMVLAAVPRGADLFDEIYEKSQPIEASLKTLKARFTETSSSPLLETPIVARGTVMALRPSKVRLDYTEPDVRTILIDGDTLTVDWPSRGLRQQQNIGAAQSRIDRYFVGRSPRELRSHFTIAASVAGDRPGTWLVRMTPKRKQIRQGLSMLELWVDRKSMMLAAMRMEFPTGDSKLMEFEDVQLNPPLDEKAFRLPPR